MAHRLTPTWRTRACSLSGLCPSTNPAWLYLLGTRIPAGTAIRVIETLKPHHQGDSPRVRHCSLVLDKARVAPLRSVAIPRLEITAATVSVRVASVLKEQSSSGLSVTNTEDSMCNLQKECSSSVTRLHPSNGGTWTLDPTQISSPDGRCA